MKPGYRRNALSSFAATLLACSPAVLAGPAAPAPLTNPAHLESPSVKLSLSPDDGRYEILDKQTGVVWRSNPFQSRFGEITYTAGGKPVRAPLGRCDVSVSNDSLSATFRTVADKPEAWVKVTITAGTVGDRAGSDTPSGPPHLAFSCEASPGLGMQGIRLLDNALWVTDSERGAAAVPVRLGLLIPADSGLAFARRFDTYAYEGCHMAMMGLVKGGATALLTWDSPYVVAEVKSQLDPGLAGAKQVLLPALELSKSATAFRLRFCGRGDHATIARAYREEAKRKGWLVPWDGKLKGGPDRAKLFGASNFKLWSCLSRQMNKESTKEESVRVSWTFEEAAQVAEHLRNDLKMDRVLFTLGGWIRRGYDNQHPDILPSAPELGGDEAFAACAKRVMDLGYLFCLHDNYQDIYKDSPSWDESFIMKRPDGKIAAGGHWAGGLAYLTCSKRALDLAKRPQNLAAVRTLTGANAYFIDTTYAAGLQECFDPQHPLAREDDLKWKRALSDYAREIFGVFGSECGREWAIPCADFFEGITGVSGRSYHDARMPEAVGGTVVPLFEIVYRDTIAMYGKYGYDPSRAAAYVLQHALIGRTLNYHNVPSHLYWKQPPAEGETLAMRALAPEIKPAGPRAFEITYRWQVEKPPAADWRAFVHFTEGDAIKLQNDHVPDPPTSRWAPGEVRQGPFTVKVPDGLTGPFQVRIGLFRPESQARATLTGAQDEQRRTTLGKLTLDGDRIAFQPSAAPSSVPHGVGCFQRADGGWAEGLHPYDRFVKNTHEILSPLNEITSRLPMTAHAFLTPDRKVQRTAFGEGDTRVEVVANLGADDYRHVSKRGGEVVLPPFGFLVEGPTFVAFHAKSWNGLVYDAPALFTLRSLDVQSLERSSKVRVFHGFGDARVKVGGTVRTAAREGIVP